MGGGGLWCCAECWPPVKMTWERSCYSNSALMCVCMKPPCTYSCLTVDWDGWKKKTMVSTLPKVSLPRVIFPVWMSQIWSMCKLDMKNWNWKFLDFHKIWGQTWGHYINPLFFLQANQPGYGSSRHAPRLWAPSEHLIEFNYDKFPSISPAFFSPTYLELSRGLYSSLV